MYRSVKRPDVIINDPERSGISVEQRVPMMNDSYGRPLSKATLATAQALEDARFNGPNDMTYNLQQPMQQVSSAPLSPASSVVPAVSSGYNSNYYDPTYPQNVELRYHRGLWGRLQRKFGTDRYRVPFVQTAPLQPEVVVRPGGSTYYRRSFQDQSDFAWVWVVLILVVLLLIVSRR